MPDVKISALPPADAPSGSDVLPIVQGGATKQTTVGQLLAGAPGAVTSVDGREGDVSLVDRYVQLTGGSVTGPLQVSPFVSVGASPAQSGVLRLPNQQAISFRNVADNGDAGTIATDAGDHLSFNAPASKWHRFLVGGTERLTVKNDSVISTVPVGVTGHIIASTALIVGTNPASTGIVRLPNNQWVMARSAANDADLPLLMATSGNVTHLNGTGAVAVTLAGSAVATFTGATATLTTPLALGTNPAATGIVRLPNNQRVVWRNAANTGDDGAVFLGSDNVMRLGSTGAVNMYSGSNVLSVDNLTTNIQGNAMLAGSGKTLSFYGATPVVRPTGTPAAATDPATTMALVNDLRAKLIALGLIG